MRCETQSSQPNSSPTSVEKHAANCKNLSFIDQEKIASNSNINRGVSWSRGCAAKESVDPGAKIRLRLASTGKETEMVF